MPANLENSVVAQDWKRSVFIPIPKKGNAKECTNYHTIALISHTGKVMLKILQARLQQYMNCELPDVQARFRKGRGTRDQIANIHWIIEKAREFQKNIYFCFTDYTKSFEGFLTSSDGKASACNVGDLGQFLDQEDPLEKEMATHSSILAWRISWTEEPGRL